MIDNMSGFWNSVPLYTQPTDFLCFAITIILFFYPFSKNKDRSYLGFLFITISVIIHIFGYELRVRKIPVYSYFINHKYYNPFSTNNNNFSCWDMFDNASYTRETSIIHYFVHQTNFYIQQKLFTPKEKLTQTEIDLTNKIIKSPTNTTQPTTNLYIFIIESLESWVISQHTTPNLYNFIENNQNILYADKIIDQTKKGRSADGQMIINTGLLPIKDGATCYRFPNNVYPSLSKLYNNTCNIIPGEQNVWNQKQMNNAYKIDNMISSTWDDMHSITKFCNIYKDFDYAMILTMSTHAPFQAYANKTNLKMPDNMPQYMANYIKSFNYTDSCMKQVFSRIQTDSILKKSTIIITSDHNTFSPNKRNEFYEYNQANNLDYKPNNTFCPLIIYSPNIPQKTIIKDTIYQMDIYPTILNLIGCENYYWQGLGTNILNTQKLNNRSISPNDASNLSNKLIINNYFTQIEK